MLLKNIDAQRMSNFRVVIYVSLVISRCTLEGSIFKVVLENVAVQRGDHFEVYPKYISPNLTNTSHRIECGYNSSVGNLIAITDWNDSLSPPSMIVPPRGTEYSDRATVRNSFIMRIKNATSQDEGRSFYCRLSNFNLHPSYYTDHVKLETVYEKPTAVEVTSSSCPQISGSHITALKCNFTGRPKVNITWNHANEIQGIKTSLHYESSWLTWTVGIFNVTKVPDADAGYHIICIGKNQFGEKAKPTVLQVKSKPSEPSEVKLELQNKTDLLVTWKKPNCSGLYSLKGYLLYYRTTLTPLFKNISVKCCLHRIENLKDGITHYVKLAAIDSRNREGTPSGIHEIYVKRKNLHYHTYKADTVIIGASVGATAGVLIIFLLILIWRVKRKKKPKNSPSQGVSNSA